MDTVGKNMVVSLEYTLSLDSGELIDETKGIPFEFIFGIGSVLPKLEKELEGMKVGDEKDIVLSPEEGYGEIDPGAIQEVPKEFFKEVDVQVGNQYYAHFEDGSEVPFYVKEIKDESIVIDFNHPLAGKTLHFHVKIVGLREATPDELEHGHLHH